MSRVVAAALTFAVMLTSNDLRIIATGLAILLLLALLVHWERSESK